MRPGTQLNRAFCAIKSIQPAAVSCDPRPDCRKAGRQTHSRRQHGRGSADRRGIPASPEQTPGALATFVPPEALTAVFQRPDA